MPDREMPEGQMRRGGAFGRGLRRFAPAMPVAFGLLIGSPAAMAEAGWTDYALVTELTPTIHQRYEVTIAVQQNPSGCREKQVFFQDYSARGSEQMYLALLESVGSGKRVRVFVTGECGVSGYSRISAVSIRS
jgi:hypothetical protein